MKEVSKFLTNPIPNKYMLNGTGSLFENHTVVIARLPIDGLDEKVFVYEVSMDTIVAKILSKEIQFIDIYYNSTVEHIDLNHIEWIMDKGYKVDIDLDPLFGTAVSEILFKTYGPKLLGVKSGKISAVYSKSRKG